MSIVSITSAAISGVLPKPKLAESMFALTQPTPADSLLESPSAAEQEFLKISQQSPIERLRAKILDDMKLSEGSLAEMAPEERQAVEEEIKRRMMDALSGMSDAEPGTMLDKSA